MTEPSILPGLSAWADRYNAIICDVWGVLHDGVTVHEGAVAALRRYRDGGGRVLLVSNSPRPGALVIEQLLGMGIPRDTFDDALSSGDIARGWLKKRPGLPIGLITAPFHAPMHDGLDLRIVGPDEADHLVVTALTDDENEMPEDYRATLERYRAADVPMLCANPDYVVERGGRLIYCAGALADMYREMGGTALDTGKPSAMIYDTAMQRFTALLGETPDKSCLLAIGDAIRTDVKGAADLGIDMLFMAKGIHADDAYSDGALDTAKLGTLFAEKGVAPTAVQETLTW